MHNIFSSFFEKSSFAAPSNGFAAERFPSRFRQYYNFVSLIRYCTERRRMLKSNHGRSVRSRRWLPRNAYIRKVRSAKTETAD